jgi:hypothetical protein
MRAGILGLTGVGRGGRGSVMLRFGLPIMSLRHS